MAVIKIQKHDSSNMRRLILDFPRQFGAGLKAAENVRSSGKFDEVLVCGMGGSALPADILKIWLDNYKIGLPLQIHRNYKIPETADRNHLVVCISYSGNTEETLSAFQEAISRKLKVAAITSGGKLAQLCKKHNVPAVIIPKEYPPRMATGFMVPALMKLLVNCGIIKNGLQDITDLENSLKPKLLESPGKKLAKKIKGKIPVVYSSDKLQGLARIWKIKFNENSKIHSFSNYFPELNHNELVGYTTPANLHAIILRDKTDFPQNQKRIRLTAELLKKRGVPVDIVEINGHNIMHKLFKNTLLADWVSYYLALELGHDPTPVKLVETFKNKLR